MGKPLSFKDMIKPKKETEKPKVFSGSLLPVMSESQREKLKLQEKEFTKFCNTLRCPLCDAQLDGGVTATKAQLFCREAPEEYKCTYHWNEDLPRYQSTRISFESFCYELSNNLKSDGTWSNVVYKVDLSMREDLRWKYKVKFVEMNGSLLPFKKQKDEQKFLDNLKTYIIFG